MFFDRNYSIEIEGEEDTNGIIGVCALKGVDGNINTYVYSLKQRELAKEPRTKALSTAGKIFDIELMPLYMKTKFTSLEEFNVKFAEKRV
jgi:hypothetical protein